VGTSSARLTATAGRTGLRSKEPPPGGGAFAGRRRALPALGAAGLCVIGLAATWALAALVPSVRWHDAVALNDFIQLDHPRVSDLANGLLHLLDPLAYTVWALLIVAVALLRRRPRVALAVALVLPSAPLAAERLKPLLAHAHAHPRAGFEVVGAGSWPSGHATAAMTLVLCALLVAPRYLRPAVAALGSVFAVAVGCSLLILAWHMPSDVLGGYLLAALFAALALAGLRATEGGRQPARARRAHEPRWRREDLLAPGAILLAGMLALALAALVRAGQVASFAGDHRLVVLAAAGIAALVTLICSTLTLALNR
jgi:membrane-associated phospholipid phosphatase